MKLDIPREAATAGFVLEPMGTHSSRTIMLHELQALLSWCPSNATPDDYRHAVIEENVTLKATLSTRAKSFRHLRELYSLSPSTPLFRALRLLWQGDAKAQPMLAILCACARDPLLRATSCFVLAKSPGEEVTPGSLAEEVAEAFTGRYGPGVLARIGRNIASSWQQAGHLQGRLRKVRSSPVQSAAATAYALFLGELCGARGQGLFETPWSRILDAPEHVMRAQAEAADQMGWLEYRFSGGVTDISFRNLMQAKAKT